MSVKKLASLSFALALVYSISLPARAELLKNLKTDGSIETRSFGIDNETDRNGRKDDYRAETNARLMLGGAFDLLDDVHARVALTNNHAFFGENADGTTPTARIGGNGSSDLNSLQSNTFVDNAYVKIDKVFGHVDLTMGRQFYGDSNDPNIYFGPNNDDILSVNALDIFRTDADIMGWAKFQGIAGKVADTGAIGAGSNTDSDLWGVEVNTDKVIPKGNLAVNYYTAQVKAVKPPAVGNNTLSTLGIRAMGDILAGLGYHAEYIQDFGRNSTIAGTPAYDGDAYILGVHFGHDLAAGYPIRAKLEYARGSDDFASIAPSHRFGLIWGEHSTAGPSTLTPTATNGGAFYGNSAVSLTNLKVITAGIGTTCPKTHIGVDLAWYRFMYDANLGGVGVSAGTEYDLILSYKHSENVSFEVNAATFQVGTSLQNPTALQPGSGTAPVGTNPITRLGADVKIKF